MRIHAASLVLVLTSSALGQGLRDVEIKTTNVAPGIYMLEGRGGNIGLCIGADGAFLIDDQFAPLVPKILDAVEALTDDPIKFVVNTHWHGDHTGGNESLGETGAIIVAHENVRSRMSKGQFMEAFDREVPPAPEAALPVVTFTEQMTFHWNDETIEIYHVDPAHTDGDSIVHFKKANVIHMGDVYFNTMYPFIDVASGGSIDGVIKAVDTALVRMNASTRVIPGHGPLSDPDGLRAYRKMLVTARTAIAHMIARDMSRDEIIAAAPTKELDAVWGGGFMQPDVWTGIVYDGLMTQWKQ